jgi:hypothetical protein
VRAAPAVEREAMAAPLSGKGLLSASSLGG